MRLDHVTLRKAHENNLNSSDIKVTDNSLEIIGCQTLHFTHILKFVEQRGCAAQHNSLPDDNSE